MSASDVEKAFCFQCMHHIFEENVNKNQRDEKTLCKNIYENNY